MPQHSVGLPLFLAASEFYSGRTQAGIKLLLTMFKLMHQSIPAVPIPPGNRRAFAHVVSSGGGAFTILSRPRGLDISIPRGEPQAFDTRVFERQISLSGRTRPLSKTGLSIRVQKNLSMFLKVCFLNFRYVFTTCKHINISDKVNYILFNTKQSLR